MMNVLIPLSMLFATLIFSYLSIVAIDNRDYVATICAIIIGALFFTLFLNYI